MYALARPFALPLEGGLLPCRQLNLKLEWKKLKNINSQYNENYSSIHPLRRVVGLIILDRKLDLGFDILMDNWLEFPGMQYFTGETVFNWERPFSKEEFEEVSSRISKELKNLFTKKYIKYVESIFQDTFK